MSKKKVVSTFRLVVEAGKANPSPPTGPALGQRGINIMAFCKEFNDRTKGEAPGSPIPADITLYADKSFSFVLRKPPMSYFIKQHMKVKSGSSLPGRVSVGEITQDGLRAIAEQKMDDLNALSVEMAMKIVAGSARSMGIQVKE
ncbi:MAG: 50S ribosomal protein L11 [Alphaproteobacteria bacterium]|nr:50S ribosomal protein L11 [Alphaproteobacteria bacterium]